MMKKAFLSSLLLVILVNLYGYNQLRVGDPRNSWWTDQGTIEEALLTVHPKGLYMEYGLYLTFSSRGTNWTSQEDTVEVSLFFDLPEGAIVHDSWLWIGEDTARAILLDKWSASAIYEGIVKRRKDPSVLYKQSATQYELRVFPMAGNETRKVKITYLIPVSFNNKIVTAVIPTAIINTSNYKPAHFSVLAFSDATWDNPLIMNDNEIQFTPESDTQSGDYYKAIIPSTKFYNTINIGYNAPIQDGYYFSKYQEGNEGIYQLAVFPRDFITVTDNIKTAILIDFDESNTNITVIELLNTIKSEMLVNLSSADSFNLLFSNLSITKYSDKWISASETNIEEAFNTLGNPLSSYSNLPSLLGSGINFIKNNGNNGKIILVSNSGQFDDFHVANTLINDIVELMDPKIQIHIADYQSINFKGNYLNGRYYYGNEYLYSNLSKITSGSLHRIVNGLSLSGSIDEAFKYIGGSIKSFDLYTRVQSGFCHSRYTITGNDNIAYLNDPILQVGKFKGAFPFTFEVSGEYNNEIFSAEIEIHEQNVIIDDTTSEEIWTGLYIKELESVQQSNDIINEIIYSSLNERVLSLYTSFLCVEDSIILINNGEDEQILIDIQDIVAEKDSISIYPNPFTDKLTIDLICSDPGKVKELSIYNITGAVIYQFSTSDLVTGKNTITWNGNTASGDAVKPGMYILVFRTTDNIKTMKIARR